MADDDRVVEDGLDLNIPEAARSRSLILWSVGLLTGLAASVVFLVSTSDSIPATSPTTVVPRDIGPLSSASSGIAEFVPDFPDTLVAISTAAELAGGDEIRVQHLLWPDDREIVVSELSVVSPVSASIDVAGTSLALVVPTDEGGVLELTTEGYQMRIGAAVTSFAWHDSHPGYAGYTKLASREWQLWKIEGSAAPRLVSTDSNSEGYVAAWGDWGWAIQRSLGSPSVLLLDASGSAVSTHPGVVLGSGPDGRLLIVNGDLVSIYSVGGATMGPERSVASLGPIARAAFSPDGLRVAVLGVDGLRILPTGSVGEVTDYKPIVGTSQVVWSSDSRYLLVPAPRGISIIDTENNTYQEVLPEYSMLAIGLMPGTN